jgi:hypothetical protein
MLTPFPIGTNVRSLEGVRQSNKLWFSANMSLMDYFTDIKSIGKSKTDDLLPSERTGRLKNRLDSTSA